MLAPYRIDGKVTPGIRHSTLVQCRKSNMPPSRAHLLGEIGEYPVELGAAGNFSCTASSDIAREKTRNLTDQNPCRAASDWADRRRPIS